MSARLARTAFTSAARRVAQAPAQRVVSRRAMSSTSHAGAHQKGSDMPWIVGSTLVFLPAFLYLVSPSARKSEHHVHDDKHDFPALKQHDEPAAQAAEPASDEGKTLMADDEGTVADVGASIETSEGADVPKSATTPEQQSANLAEAEGNTTPTPSPAYTPAQTEGSGDSVHTELKDKPMHAEDVPEDKPEASKATEGGLHKNLEKQPGGSADAN